MRALVTGGAGFIGSHLTDRLLEMGFDVVCVDDLSNGLASNINPKSEFHKMDIRDQLLRGIMRGVDHVFHLAALGSVPRSFKMPWRYKSVNIDGFYNVLRSAEISAVKSFVYASSSSVYGDSKELPKREENIGAQLSPYSMTKRVNELMAEVSPIKTVGLRYFNVFGKRQRSDIEYPAVIPKWVDLMKKRSEIVIHGDGSAFRDFTHVDNVVDANLLAMNSKESGVYNVGTGKFTIMNDLLCNIRNSLGVGNDDLNIKWDTDNKPLISQSLASIDKISNDLGYVPKVDLVEGLERMAK